MAGNIKYEVVDDYDYLFDEKGNAFLAIRKVRWGDNEKVNLDMRKWYTNANGEETLGKGVSFLTEEGPHELARVLVQNDFGHTDEILEAIKDREDFMPALASVLNGEQMKELGINKDDIPDDDYMDPSILIA